MQTYRTRIAIMAAADRGGPFVHANGSARNWMRAAPPGIGFRCLPRGESSPIGRGHAGESSSRRWIAACIVLLVIFGAASLGGGVYLHAKAQVAQWLLHA